MSTLEIVIAAATALACGVMIGTERERSHARGTVSGGVRTYALLALVGLVAAALGPWVIAAALVVVGALVAIGYVRTSVTDIGSTSEVAGLIAFALGALAWSRPAVAAGLAVAVTVVLASKQRLHRFVRDVVSDTELEDALKFFVAAFVVLPLLPEGSIGPYGVLDARRIWTIVVVLTGVSAAGYIATRWFGAGRGLAVTGLAGGFVSASATTGAMALRARDPSVRRVALSAALLASVSTMLQLLGLTLVAYPPLLPPLMPTIVVGIATLLATAWWNNRGTPSLNEPSSATVGGRVAGADLPPEFEGSTTGSHAVGDAVNQADGAHPAPPESPAETGRLFAIVPALILAVLLTLATLAARWGVDVFGSSGIVGAAGLAGLADAHAGALATATVLREGAISTAVALTAVGAALFTNTVVKMVLAFVGGGLDIGRRYTVLMLIPIVSIAVTLTVTVRLIM